MDILTQTLKNITSINHLLMQETQIRLDNLTKPQGSLGRLEDLAKEIAGITGQKNPDVSRKVIFILVADHGVTEENVSAFPKEVTAQMVYNFLSGGAGINVLAKHAGAKVVVADVGVAVDLAQKNGLIVKKIACGTRNMAKTAAMSSDQAIQAIETGITIFENEFKNGIDIIGTGEMGIGNTTASSAITAVLTKNDVVDVTGRGTGIDERGLKHKISVIKKSLKINQPDHSDPLDVLAKVGGFEIGGITGIILAAAARKIPVVIDGFNSGAAALIAYTLQPLSKEYMIASHESVEKGHAVILKKLGLKPILNLGLRLGEGTGAALAMPLIEASLKILTQMASFQSANVSQKLPQ
ncbi:MAG: nicotinate-nucleotide--dimethylbenzimidazole phosphoribosyltransferase [Candidatus Omnitrophota bacterium]|jgi:nicotinate-nucleotide--dimethylbenzimidazole phosphoribosyltransferase